MAAGGEAEVLGELAVQLELVGVLELAWVTVGRRQPEPHDVALLHRAAVEVDVLGDVAAVLDEQAVQADELLDGVGDQLGLVDQQSGRSDSWVARWWKMYPSSLRVVSRPASMIVKHSVMHVLVRQRRTVGLGLQQVGDEVGRGVPW